MMLATQCPFCQTTFRVAPDQLALREGLVRCGNCKEVFDGNAHLIDPEPFAAPPVPVPVPPADTHAPVAPPAWMAEHLADTFASVAAATNDAPWGTPIENNSTATTPSLSAKSELPPPTGRIGIIEQSMAQGNTRGEAVTKTPPTPASLNSALGLRQETAFEASRADDDIGFAAIPDSPLPTQVQHAPNDKADEDLPEQDFEESSDTAPPSFVQSAERRERVHRIGRLGMAVASALLAITLLFQLLYLGRNQLLSWLPATYTPLSAMCVALHCTLGLPSNIEQLSLESSELQQLSPNQNIYTLSVLLRNHSHATQSWPYLELTLNDGDDKAIIRRVFTPSEYLPTTMPLGDGFAAQSEQAIKLTFELAQPAASGYRVYLFFP